MEYSSNPSSWWEWALSVGLPLVVVLRIVGPLLLRGSRNSGLLARGKLAPAIIRQVRQTGTTVNDQPELELELWVSTEDGRAFHARCFVLIKLLDLHRTQVGAQVFVCYDPKDTTYVAFAEFEPSPKELDATAFELTRRASTEWERPRRPRTP